MDYRFEPAFIGPCSACKIRKRDRYDHFDRKGCLLGRCVGSATAFSDRYYSLFGTDIFYVNEFFDFINDYEEGKIEIDKCFCSFKTQLMTMRSMMMPTTTSTKKNIFTERRVDSECEESGDDEDKELEETAPKVSIAAIYKSFSLYGVVVKAPPIYEARMGEEESVVGFGDLSSVPSKQEIILRNDNEMEYVCNKLRIPVSHFVDLSLYDVPKAVQRLFTGIISGRQELQDIFEDCALLTVEQTYPIYGCYVDLVIAKSVETHKIFWWYVFHKNHIYDDLIDVINSQAPDLNRLIPVLVVPVGKTNPQSTDLPYEIVDGCAMIDHFCFLPNPSEHQLYVPMPIGKKQLSITVAIDLVSGGGEKIAPPSPASPSKENSLIEILSKFDFEKDTVKAESTGELRKELNEMTKECKRKLHLSRKCAGSSAVKNPFSDNIPDELVWTCIYECLKAFNGETFHLFGNMKHRPGDKIDDTVENFIKSFHDEQSRQLFDAYFHWGLVQVSKSDLICSLDEFLRVMYCKYVEDRITVSAMTTTTTATKDKKRHVNFDRDDSGEPKLKQRRKSSDL